MKTIIKIFISSFFLSFFFSTYAFAQSIDMSVNLNPENPTPKSNVTLTLDSYSFDVNTSMITWKIGGRVVLRGLGQKNLTIKTGAVGESTVVNVLAENDDSSSVQKNITISPSSVSLFFEAPRSYVPFFYKGKALPSDGALVQVTALPQISDHGIPVSPSSLSYVWTVGDTVIDSLSGINRQSVPIRLSYLTSTTDVTVKVRSPAGNVAEKTISIYPHTILPLLYTYDPILGSNFSNLVTNRFETTKDFTLALEPFYISTHEQDDPMYNWFLDGAPFDPLDGKHLSLHPQENSFGSKMLAINLTGPIRMQEAATQLEIIFDTRK